MTMFYCAATSLYNSVKVTNNTVYTRTNHTLITIMKGTRMISSLNMAHCDRY